LFHLDPYLGEANIKADGITVTPFAVPCPKALTWQLINFSQKRAQSEEKVIIVLSIVLFKVTK